MEEIFKWIGAAILIMLSLISGYKVIKQRTVTKNVITLVIVTVMSTLILFGIRPAVIEFYRFKVHFNPDSIIYSNDSVIQEVLSKTNIILEIDPANPEFWTTDSNFVFKWYNAPYGLAIDLGKMNMNNINNLNVTYQLLLIEGNDDEERKEFQRRYKRMKEFLLYMEKHNTPVRNKVEIKVLENERIPSISIYLFSKENKPVSNFYIDPLINKGGKTYKAFQTYSESVVFFLDKEFEDSWEIAKEIPMDSILIK